MADQYHSFAALAAREVKDVHYRIRLMARRSPIAIVAPHGGFIEPGTSELAAAIAGETHSLYCFESLTMRAKGDGLHITSTRFDEPQALLLAARSDIVVGVHGRKNGADASTVWVGGLHEELRDTICAALTVCGFRAKAVGDGHPLAGRDPANICNKGRLGAGVQLELPRALRIAFAKDAAISRAFAEAVRRTLRS
ncbi:poly-gamma-glutamate hydrolase family protein [Methylocystis iwaonis]|uniref:poly-gamma-glutamate hydrolase family protein n=1 Tax=Methylocystis iwaonis TaxID=2885079 RepID=UPI002E7B91F1|nr:poly-gamma-glutamate hydrolase family protein [Methylocystis iwaonis]